MAALPLQPAGGWLGLALVLPLAALACAGHGKADPAAGRAVECAPVVSKLSQDPPWDSLGGRWRLTMIATSGPMTGKRAEGVLTLATRDVAVRRVERPGTSDLTVPVIGSTDIALESVGAVRMGDVTSTDPNQPGVAIWVTGTPDSAGSAVLRIGQEALKTDLLRFDGGYTALFLQEVTPNTLRGTWSSGVTRRESAGHFCGARAE